MIIRPGVAADRDAVADLFRRISAESFYQRFQTARGPAPSPGLVDRLLPLSPDAGSLLVFDGCRQLVGHGMWVRVDVPRAAEIALVVTDSHQRRGIGKELIRRTHEAAGLHTTLILLSAPQARDYYPHIGMTQHESCWIIPRATT